MEVYRDGACVLWRAETGKGRVDVARTFDSAVVRAVEVIPGQGGLSFGALQKDPGLWATDAEVAASDQRVADLKALSAERALLAAQAALIEEDLEVLRANRSVGGTAEAVLVEDLEAVSDWMHTAFRDVLYRRVEVAEELAELDVRLDQMRATAPPQDKVTTWHLPWTGGEGETLWCRTWLEAPCHWSPSDVLEVSGDDATWHARATYELAVPHRGEVPVQFIDATLAEAFNQDRQGLSSPTTYDRKPQTDASPVRVSASLSRRSPVVTIVLDGRASGSLAWAEQAVKVKRAWVTTPKEASAATLSLGIPDVSVRTASNAVELLLDGRMPSAGVVSDEGDSLRIDAGFDAQWTVIRERESGLCRRSALGQSIVHRRAFAIRVNHGGDVPGRITVVEPLPRSRDLEIEVDPQALDGGTLDEVNEQIVWTLVLAPNQTRTLQFAYDVRHDRDLKAPALD